MVQIDELNQTMEENMVLDFLNLLIIPFLIAVISILLFRIGGRLASQGEIFKCVRTLWIRYHFLLRGSDVLIDGYKHSNGEPYLILDPKRTTTMITSRHHIRELEKAPRHMLSLHAVAKDFIQPKYTMNGFEWKDQRGVEGTAYVVALHNLLTDRLHELVPKVHAILLETLQAEIANSGSKSGEWNLLSVYAIAKRLVTNANCAIFFPKELAENEEFQKAAVAWPMDVAIAAEMIQLLPRGMGPLIGKLLTRNHRSTKVMYDFIFPVIKERFLEQMSGTGIQETEPDLVTQVLSTMPKKASWSPERLAGEVMAVWFGSLHTLSLPSTSALIDLCMHPEYIESLKEEAEGPEWEGFFRTGHGLPRIDSFLMESARLNLFEGTPIRRHALQEFVFSDGLKISKGDWVSVPVRPMMRDERNFSNPMAFDGRRFLQQIVEDMTKKASGISHTSDLWMLWGTGTRLLCPGRYYASAILKIIVAIMVTKYDFELEPRNGSPYMQWRTAFIVHPSLRLRVKGKDSKPE